MYSELYTATSGMLAQWDRIEVLAHNMANVNTVAFKMEHLLGEERPSYTRGGRIVAPSHVRSARWTDFSQGELEPTGEPLDLAIEGDGFFVVQTPGGLRLTRDGHFSRDGDGRLVLRGMPVMGDGGEINLQSEGEIRIRTDGTVVQNDGEIGRIRVVRVQSPGRLRRQEGGLYEPPAGGGMEELDEPGVHQGYLERSNARIIQLMVGMTHTLRLFEMHQKALQTIDQLGQKAVQRLARA